MNDLIVRFGPTIVSFILTGVLGLIIYSMRKTYVSKEDYQDDKETQITTNNSLENRVSAVEVAVQNQPSSDDLHDLSISNVRLEEQVKNMSEMLKSLHRQLNLMDSYLRKGEN